MPNSKHRALVTPAKRGKGNKAKAPEEGQTRAERHSAMTWPLSHILVLRGTWASCPMGATPQAGVQD